jgi:hypothetical protein
MQVHEMLHLGEHEEVLRHGRVAPRGLRA